MYISKMMCALLYLHTTKTWKGNWTGHISCGNCFLIHVIEGNIAGRIVVMGRRGRRNEQLLDGKYWKRITRSQSMDN